MVVIDWTIIRQVTGACHAGSHRRCIGFSTCMHDEWPSSARPCACSCHTISEVTA